MLIHDKTTCAYNVGYKLLLPREVKRHQTQKQKNIVILILEATLILTSLLSDINQVRQHNMNSGHPENHI